jgi:hypothetical protein
VQPPVLPASQFTAFRVMVVCRKKGCRKRPRWPSTFCTTHAMAEDLLPRKAVAALPTQSPKNQAGFWGTIVFDNKDVMRAIKRCVDVDSNQKNLNTGYRSFSNLNLAIEPLLELIQLFRSHVPMFLIIDILFDQPLRLGSGPLTETLLCDGGSRVEATIVINRLAVKIDPHLAHLDFVHEPPQTRNKLTFVVRVLELIFELINTSWRPVVIRNFSLDDHGL